MKKTFINAILITSTAFVALMIATPLSHLSAQNEVVIDAKQKVHKTSITAVNVDSQTFSIEVDGATIPVRTDASTTVSLADGNNTEFNALRAGANVYVFGTYDPASKAILAEKVVLRNKSKTERTTLSRAELEQRASLPVASRGSGDSLGLTVK